MSEKIRTIGVSILGGKSGTQGRYELGIQSIRALNEVSDASVIHIVGTYLKPFRNQSQRQTSRPLKYSILLFVQHTTMFSCVYNSRIVYLKLQ